VSPVKLVVAAGVLVLLCAAALGFSARDDQGSVGDPADSPLAFLTELFPQRDLDGEDVASVECFDAPTATFAVAAAATCSFVVPDGVERIRARWAAGAAEAVLARPSSLTQTYRADDEPQDADRPDEVDMPVFGDGTVLTLSCAGAAACAMSLR
jgi:hypothetical protein